MVPQKVLIYDSEILLLGIYPKEPKKCDSDTHMPMFTVALFTIAKKWKKHKGLSTNKWINKMWYIYRHVLYDSTYMKYLKKANSWRQKAE